MKTLCVCVCVCVCAGYVVRTKCSQKVGEPEIFDIVVIIFDPQ